ncbi:MAG TPA: permease prefix domain 1-containing protein, partial [Longimicrobiales bacterium]|nr:permease prefix domain 1-containing protein [Longimicrobiales bacterium]
MIRPRIRRFFRLRPRAREDVVRHVDEEIRLHIELRAEQLMRGGMPAHEALAEAERRFGRPSARWDLHRTATQREGVLNMRDWLDSWLQDLRYAIRALVHEPLLAGMVILTLGLGIGANASMFGIIDRLLL